MSLAVVGTDTGVGKTVVSALILARYGGAVLDGMGPAARRPGGGDPNGPPARLAYWKPISTGAERDRDSIFVRTRVGDLADVLDETYRFNPPVSPHLAAQRAGVEIEMERLVSTWQTIRAVPGRHLLVEGIGGALVPLNAKGVYLADFIGKLRVPVLVIARTALGTINHTLLTLEALRKRRMSPVGVVLNGPPRAGTREAIEEFGKTRVIDEVGPLVGGENPSRAAIISAAPAFDAAGILAEYLATPAGAADG